MMKKTFVFTLFAAFIFVSVSASNTVLPAETKAMPDNVKAIIEKSCFGCHNTDSKNDKAKEKLLFNNLETLPKADLIHALSEIGKTVSEGDMPPPKFLERFPDKKLTDDEKKVLLDWADAEAKAQLKK